MSKNFSLNEFTRLFNLLNNQLKFTDCQKSANINDPDRIFWLGYCYEHGIGIEMDKNKALVYYQKSAEMKNPRGLYQVAHFYYLGIGVEVNKDKAFMYYLKSAEAGNAVGIFKTAICYYFGIGVKMNKGKYFKWLNKNSKYGKCAQCNEDNTSEAWCFTCDPDLTIREWTSENKYVDNFMKDFQLRSTHYERMIEWISFDRLDDIKIIGQGGFSTVYSATWLDGVRKIEKVKKNNGNDVDIEEYVRSRGPPCTVALKTLLGPKENPHFFLKEFECFIKCGYWGSGLKLYGLTQNPNTNDYMIAFQYAENGSLYKFLSSNFQVLSWKTKLKLMIDISLELRNVHFAGYIHADLHSGNVLQDGGINKNLRSYVSDLGLSKKYNTNESKSGIYGVLPYIAPEVLSGQKFTKASDIYGFGVIMSEMSTGQRPFDGRPFNLNLSIDICRGLRPGFASGTPESYIELAKQCMDSDPKKRPVAYDIWIKLKEWNDIMESSDEANEIRKEFLNADEISKELPIIPPKHPDSMYTSKIIDTQIISSALIKGMIPSETLNSVQIPFV